MNSNLPLWERTTPWRVLKRQVPSDQRHVGDAVDAIKGAFPDGINPVDDVVDIAVDMAGNFGSAYNSAMNNVSHLGTMVWDIFRGSTPSISALGSQLILAAGSMGNLAQVTSTLGLVNPGLFEDGQPYAGKPMEVTNGSASPWQMPHSMSGTFGSVEDAYAMGNVPGTEDGAIRILQAEQPDGSFAFIDTVDPRVHVLNVQHAGDKVPQLDLGGLGMDPRSLGTQPNVTVATMDDQPRDLLGNIISVVSPAGSFVHDALATHKSENYMESMSNTAKYPDILAYENDPSMSAFISNDPSQVTAVDTPWAGSRIRGYQGRQT